MIAVIILALVLEVKGRRWGEEELRTVAWQQEHLENCGSLVGWLAYLTRPVCPHSVPALHPLYPFIPFSLNPPTPYPPGPLPLYLLETHLLRFLLMTS